MFNRLFSALENTRVSISQAFKGISAGSITNEQLDNIEEKADEVYEKVKKKKKDKKKKKKKDMKRD